MMTWSELLHRLVLVQGTTRLCAARDLDELDIVGRVMRKENYLIGMLNAGVLGLYVKGLGPFGGRRFMLTKTLEWNLYLCILDPMFDEHFHIKQVRGCLGWACGCCECCGFDATRDERATNTREAVSADVLASLPSLEHHACCRLDMCCSAASNDTLLAMHCSDSHPDCVQGFLSDETALRQRLVKAAVINLLLAPFLLMFLVIYFFMKHAERFYHSPGKQVFSNTSHRVLLLA